MKTMRKNDGFTLVELMVTILVSTIITLAATTVLLLGIRIMHKSTDSVERQHTTRVLLTALEDLAAEGTITEVKKVTDGWQVLNGTKVVFSYDGETDTVYTGAPEENAPLLDGIEDSAVTLTGNILTVTVKPEGQAPYETSIYCRMIPDNYGRDNAVAQLIERLRDNDLTNVDPILDGVPNPLGRNIFLKTLASQYGSRGYIIGENGPTDQYYSGWYIGGYNDQNREDGWNENTPWCACFVSWALSGNANLSGAPRVAFVDEPDEDDTTEYEDFRGYFVDRGTWQDSTDGMQPGDLIFFNTDADDQADHMGVVLMIQDDIVYTIEGNYYGRVTVCRHEVTDPRIEGYGVLPWTG